MNGLPSVSGCRKAWVYLSSVQCYLQGWWILDVKCKSHVKLSTGKYFAHSEDISDMETRQDSCNWRVEIGTYSFGDFSGPGVLFSFFLSSLLITSWLGVRSHSIVSTVQGDRPSCWMLTRTQDALGLRSWTEASSGALNAINLAHPTPSEWSSWLTSLKGVKQPKLVFVLPSSLLLPPTPQGLLYPVVIVGP